MGFNKIVSSTFGLVLNLYQNDTMDLLIGALLLNPSNRVSSGSKVNGILQLLRLILGDFAISSILHPLASNNQFQVPLMSNMLGLWLLLDVLSL